MSLNSGQRIQLFSSFINSTKAGDIYQGCSFLNAFLYSSNSFNGAKITPADNMQYINKDIQALRLIDPQIEVYFKTNYKPYANFPNGDAIAIFFSASKQTEVNEYLLDTSPSGAFLEWFNIAEYIQNY